jgi:hypothetical protein
MAYSGAGDGQCCGLKNDGQRCENGVYGDDVFCGTHKNADRVHLAPYDDEREWYRCSECGWQPADWPDGGGDPPHCSKCGIEFGPRIVEFQDAVRRSFQ